MTVSRTRVARWAWSVAFVLCVAVAGAGAIVLADEWPLPQVREVFSASRNHFVRVTPGDSWGDTFGFAGSPKGRYAKAEFFQRRDDGAYAPAGTITLLNPIAPVEYFVSDRGYLLTLDNWHNTGYGKVFALYSQGGGLVQSYELADLFSKEEIEKFNHSASSILWHKGATFLQADQKTLYVSVDDKGGDVSFDTETGAYRYCEWHGSATNFACRRSNANRVWRPFNSNE